MLLIVRLVWLNSASLLARLCVCGCGLIVSW